MSWLAPDFFVYYDAQREAADAGFSNGLVYSSVPALEFMWAEGQVEALWGHDSGAPYFSYYLMGQTLATAKPFLVNAQGILRGNDGEPLRYLGGYPWSGAWDLPGNSPNGYTIQQYYPNLPSFSPPLFLFPIAVPARFGTGLGDGVRLGSWTTFGGDGDGWSGGIALTRYRSRAWRLTFCWMGSTYDPGIGATSIWEKAGMDTPIGAYSKVGGDNTGGTYGVDTLSDVTLSYAP